MAEALVADTSSEHGFYARDSSHALPPVQWPHGKRVALAFLVSAEYYDLYPGEKAFTPANVPGGFGRGPYPDYRAFSMREYGNRVGAFRLLELFAAHGVPGSLAADRHVALHRTAIVERALALGWPLVGHGLSVTEVIGEHLSAHEERAYLKASLEPLHRFGHQVMGWHGPEYAQSSRTPGLLAEQGLRYMLDWPHDERVVPMSTAAGTLLSLPMSADLDDVMAHWHRKISMARWVRSVLEAVEQLAAESDGGARLLVVNLHPWLMGQPYRITYLAELLEALVRRTDIWLTTTDDIARHAWPVVTGTTAPGQPPSRCGA